MAMDYTNLINSWKIHLQAERKSPLTIKSYTGGMRSWLSYCDRTGTDPEITRDGVMGYMADLLSNGAEPATAVAHLFGVRRFSAWLHGEGLIATDPLLGIRPPTLDQKHVDRLTDSECAELIRACSGPEFRDRRDEAIVRLMIETALRAGEVLAMTISDTSISNGLAIIRRGKGGKARTVSFGPRTMRSMDRYLRARSGHVLADNDRFWLGEHGSLFSYSALWKSLGKRAKVAGIKDFHPHVLRHTASQRWLSAGGSEGGLMSMAGWTRRDMLDRYTRATASERMIDEARGLNLGNL